MGKGKKYEPKPWQNGGSTNHKFSPLYASMMRSEAWVRLPCSAKALYPVLELQYNGSKNEVILTVEQAAAALGVSKPTAQRAFHALEAGGFIELLTNRPEKGGRALGAHLPNTYKFSCKWATKEKTDSG